jgi:hypothetical protein
MNETSDFFYENSFGQTRLTGVVDKGQAADVRGWYDVSVSFAICDGNAYSNLAAEAG